jgi:hypothetical protein
MAWDDPSDMSDDDLLIVIVSSYTSSQSDSYQIIINWVIITSTSIMFNLFEMQPPSRPHNLSDRDS